MNTLPYSFEHTHAALVDWFTTMSVKIESLEDGCQYNCSGHGSCLSGHCACLVQYTGGSCSENNDDYFIAFGSIFASLCVVAFIQLCLRIKTEYFLQKRKSIIQAVFKPTAPKLLYGLTIFATAVRGVYFFTKWRIPEMASAHLWTSYYPLLLSCFSFIVCFWAEAFHLGVTGDKPRFLSKSYVGFLVFNLIIYTMLTVQLVLMHTNTDDLQYLDFVSKVTKGCFAGIIVISVIFFLIYGVEVYFKVRGAFRKGNIHVDPWQLHMSRIGLISQAILQLVLAFFLFCDITKEFWKDSLPILSQNFYDIGFRIAEFGVAMWFPCVLWNWKSPESLWVLNPKRLFTSFDIYQDPDIQEQATSEKYVNYGSCENLDIKHDCWICYDPERLDAGPLIQPCDCKGDTSTAHHECLRKWLFECAESDGDFKCRVCNSKYKLKVGWTWIPKSLKSRNWALTFGLLVIMVGCPFGAYAILHTQAETQTYIEVLVIGLSLLAEITCLRFLAVNLGMCYRRGRVSTISISNRQKPRKKAANSHRVPHINSISNQAEDTSNTASGHMEDAGPSNQDTCIIQNSTTCEPRGDNSHTITVEAVINDHSVK